MKTKILFCLYCGVSKLLFAALLSSLLLAPAKVEADEPAAPKNEINIYYMKGKERLLEGRFEEAAKYLELAQKEDPNSAFVNHQLAQVYLQLNQFDKAESFAKKATELDAKSVEYRATLGGVYASNRKYSEAKEQYAKIIELEPSNAKAPLFLGILEAESGNAEKGIATLTKVLSDNPDNAMALFYRAKIYLETEKIEEAKGDLDRCLTLRPSFAEAGTALGLIHERLNNIDEAIKTYNRIQGSGQFQKRLAILYLQKNEMEKALDQLVAYSSSQPDDYSASVRIGLIYFEMKKYDLAKERFLSVLKVQQDSDKVRFYLGWVYEEQKQWTSAIEQFKKVTKESDLFFKEAMLHIGMIYKETSKVKEGLEFSRGLIKKHSEIPEFYDLQASFYELQKNYKKALEVISAGLKKVPDNENLLYFEGALLDKTGDSAKGIANMRKILTANPDNAHAMNFLAYTFAEKGENLEEAEKLALKALSLKPNDGYITDSLGWVLFKQGKVEEALEKLEKAALLKPDEAVIFEHLGDVYGAKKELAKAEEYYKKAVTFTAKKDKEAAKKLEGKLAALSPSSPAKDKKEKRVPSAEEPKAD